MADTPDFGPTGYSQDTAAGAAHLDVDLGDLLAQLETLNVHQANIENATLSISAATVVTGAPLRYGSGKPIFLESWEYNQKAWYGSGSGTDGIQRRSEEAFWTKGWSYELTCSSDSTRRASVSIRMGSYPAGPMGLQWAFTWDTRTDYVLLEGVFVDPDNRWNPEVRIDYNEKKIQILDGGSAWQDILAWDVITKGDGDWHFIKVTFDTATGMWDTLYFDFEAEDISEHALEAGSASDIGYIYFEFNHFGEVDYNATMYLDDICLSDES